MVRGCEVDVQRYSGCVGGPILPVAPVLAVNCLAHLYPVKSRGVIILVFISHYIADSYNVLCCWSKQLSCNYTSACKQPGSASEHRLSRILSTKITQLSSRCQRSQCVSRPAEAVPSQHLNTFLTYFRVPRCWLT